MHKHEPLTPANHHTGPVSEGNRSVVRISITTGVRKVMASIKPPLWLVQWELTSQLLVGSRSIRAADGDGCIRDKTVVVITLCRAQTDAVQMFFQICTYPCNLDGVAF